MDKLELEELLEEIFPNFQIRKARDGQIVIYTGMTEDEDGTLVSTDEYEEADLDEDTVPLVDDEEEDE